MKLLFKAFFSVFLFFFAILFTSYVLGWTLVLVVKDLWSWTKYKWKNGWNAPTYPRKWL